MARFETIVRPMIFPNIRPARTRAVTPESDPESGFATIRGSGGTVLNLPYSYNLSSSKAKQKEVKRKVDKVRVYQKEDDGTINRDNFVDINVVKKLWINEPGASGGIASTGTASLPGIGSGDYETPTTYRPVDDADNIKIMEKDVIIKNTEG